MPRMAWWSFIVISLWINTIRILKPKSFLIRKQHNLIKANEFPWGIYQEQFWPWVLILSRKQCLEQCLLAESGIPSKRQTISKWLVFTNHKKKPKKSFLIGYNDLIGVVFCWIDSSSGQADCAGSHLLLTCQRQILCRRVTVPLLMAARGMWGLAAAAVGMGSCPKPKYSSVMWPLEWVLLLKHLLLWLAGSAYPLIKRLLI